MSNLSVMSDLSVMRKFNFNQDYTQWSLFRREVGGYKGVWPLGDSGDSRAYEAVCDAFLKNYNRISSWDPRLISRIENDLDGERLYALIDRGKYTYLLQEELNAFNKEWKNKSDGSTSPVRIPGTEISDQITSGIIDRLNTVKESLSNKDINLEEYKSAFYKIISSVDGPNPLLRFLNGGTVLEALLNPYAAEVVIDRIQKMRDVLGVNGGIGPTQADEGNKNNPNIQNSQNSESFNTEPFFSISEI